LKPFVKFLDAVFSTKIHGVIKFFKKACFLGGDNLVGFEIPEYQIGNCFREFLFTNPMFLIDSINGAKSPLS
jgi:hypothetical protein